MELLYHRRMCSAWYDVRSATASKSLLWMSSVVIELQCGTSYVPFSLLFATTSMDRRVLLPFLQRPRGTVPSMRLLDTSSTVSTGRLPSVGGSVPVIMLLAMPRFKSRSNVSIVLGMVPVTWLRSSCSTSRLHFRSARADSTSASAVCFVQVFLNSSPITSPFISLPLPQLHWNSPAATVLQQVPSAPPGVHTGSPAQHVTPSQQQYEVDSFIATMKGWPGMLSRGTGMEHGPSVSHREELSQLGPSVSE
mmetsp:Transcript_35571/g.105130  ORF Transcript_35571/g.105130 Transcript_35571/m.105130 type:complete len:250 (+) Transcript_35571:2324-3073(+)